MRFVDEFGSLFKTFGLARSENEQSAGMFALEGAKRDEGERLFTGNNAACHDYGRAPTAPGFGFKPVCKRRGGRNFQVVLQIAADVNAIRGCAKRSDARRILFALH